MPTTSESSRVPRFDMMPILQTAKEKDSENDEDREREKERISEHLATTFGPARCHPHWQIRHLRLSSLFRFSDNFPHSFIPPYLNLTKKSHASTNRMSLELFWPEILDSSVFAIVFLHRRMRYFNFPIFRKRPLTPDTSHTHLFDVLIETRISIKFTKSHFIVSQKKNIFVANTKNSCKR